MNTIKISVVATLVALCIATNYALIGVHQIKAMDFIVFIGGFCFGPFAGALIGILTWAVYGTINPYGFIPRVWLATMFSEPIYGVVGGLLGTSLASSDLDNQRLRLSILLGTTGFVLTVIYDLVTNIVFASVFNQSIIVAIAWGAPSAVLHELSNATIFAVGSFPMIKAIRKITGR